LTGQPSDLGLEVESEQRHVDRVYARLDAVKADAAAVRTDGHRRAQVGNVGGLYERDVMVHEAARRLQTLDSEYDGLVFGRLDLDSGAVRYVGRLGLRDERFEPLVMDWRAPASAPFYQATPADRMSVVRRRVLRCLGHKVIGVEDDLLAPGSVPDGMRIIGDGALLATLARGTGTTMRDIVATIQHEQDVAVRAPASGATVVSGGPGTGKTAVALHRIAYLLYNDRRRFEGGGVLLVGPSPVFVSYISQVLPSLGEESVHLRSLGDLFDGVTALRRDEPDVAALKGSLRIRDLLTAAVRAPAPGTPDTLRIVYGGEVITLDAAELAGVRRRVNARRTPPNNARTLAVQELIATLWNKAMSWADRPNWDQAQFKAEIWDRPEFVDFAYDWWPTLTPAAVLRALSDRRRLERLARHRYSRKEIATLANSWSADGFSVADVPLLDELRLLLGEPRRRHRRRKPPRDESEYRELSTVADRQLTREAVERGPHYDEYAHIVVDEAQDLSPMQWRMLGRRGKYASWTIVGDAAQSSWGDPLEAVQARDRAVGGGPRRSFTLSTNYRNPAEIFDFAAKLVRAAVPDADLPTAVRSTGHHPVHRVVDDLATTVREEVAALLAQVEGTVGVITTARRRDESEAWLADLPGAERAHAVSSLDAKGMEYDGVVVVEPDEIRAESAAGHRTLYVALTRATQRLVTVAADGGWLATPPARDSPQ
jgi:DNA helicase IV